MAYSNETEELLRKAAAQLGVGALGTDAAAGERVKKLIGGLSPADAAKVNGILSDPEQARKLLATPQARRLLESLTSRGGGKG